MNINIVDILIIAILGLSIVSGMYKGFLSSLFATFGFVGAWFSAMNFYPRLAEMILNNKNLMDVLKYYLDAGQLFKTPAIGTTLVQNITADAAQLNEAVQQLSDSLPSSIVEAFRLNVTSQLFRTTTENGVAVPWLNNFADYLNQTIWGSVVNVVSFIAVFVITYIILLLVVNLLNSVFHFPLLRHFDWFLGGVFGGMRGYVVLMLVMTMVPMLLSVVNMEEITQLFTDSALMQYFPTNFVIPDIIKQAFS